MSESESLDALAKRIKESREVYIFHSKCGGFWFWAVDMRGNKRDIDKAIATAVRQGDTVTFYQPGERPIDDIKSCRCWQTSEATS